MSDAAMPKEIFTVKYDGQALDNHEMDVAVLAPALMSLGKLTKAISEIASNGHYTATLSVKGNVKSGSIEIELVTQAVSLLKQMQDMFTGESATAIANFFGVATGISGALAGIYALILRTRGASPSKVEKQGDTVIMHFESHSETVHHAVYHIYNNYEIRNHIYETLKPLDEQGITEFSIIQGQETLVKVDESQLSNFVPNNITTPLNENISEKILVLEGISFKEKNKWSFHDGQNSIKAIILDDDFLTEVDNGKRFAKGDWLKVQLKTIQTEEAGKLKSSHEVIKVLEHIVREQYKLDI